MAIYSLHVKTVSRSAGRSVVAAAAYRAAENVVDDRLGVVWDFTRKSGVLHAGIITPADAPEWIRDRAELWNAAERVEDKSTRRSNATTGRDIIVALPHELSDAQRLEAVRQFAASLVERYSVAVDFAIHAPDRHSDTRNFHGHLLMTTRRIGAEGFGKKTRELDDFTTGPREIEAIRLTWERIGNRALERAGLDIRMDCRSFADQGIDREATVHLGPVAAGMERTGQATDLGDRNRAVRARNAERDRLIEDKATLSAEIIDLAAERDRRAEERELRAAIRTRSPPRILDALTERRATFDRADLNRALAKVIVDPKERGTLTDQILSLEEVIGLKESETAPVSRYTTRRVLADEARVVNDAAALTGRNGYGLTARQCDALLAEHPRLKAEQRAAIRYATGASGFAVIAGESATGKSAALSVIRDAYAAAGYRVIGMAWTNAVVQDMRHSGYREATTIASELKRLESGATQWDRRTVLILDEAGMLSTKHLAAVTSQARAAGAKLIIAGDDKQLASIERGGLFGALKEQHKGAELHEVVRVSDAEQKRAFNLMHKGEYLPALAIFARQGAIRWTGKEEAAFAGLVEQWARDSGTDPIKSRFVFAYTNAQVAKLNEALRAVRKGQGALGADHMLATADGPLPFAVNDRIQFTGSAWRRADKDAGIVNGGAGTIRAIEGDQVTVALSDKPGGRERLVSFTVGKDRENGEVDQFRHGYAGTIYKGQGRTIDSTYLLHSRHWRSASAYVALTRHRESVSVFVATETARDLGQLARQMARIDETRSASQFHLSEDPKPANPSNMAERRTRATDAAAQRRAGQTEAVCGDSAKTAADEVLRETREAAAEARRREQDQEYARERERGGRSR
jgi:ATP-dependent exoDNAse (exonuclease V) alpha subunit